MLLKRAQGNLSNDDGDGNEDGKKAIELDWQNNNFTRPSHLYISLPSLHDYIMKLSVISRFVDATWTQATINAFFSWILIQSFRIQRQKNSPTSDE